MRTEHNRRRFLTLIGTRESTNFASPVLSITHRIIDLAYPCRRSDVPLTDSRTADIDGATFPTPSLSHDDPFVDSIAAQTYRPGYLGPTSYAAILPKNNESPLTADRRTSIDSDESNHVLDHQHPLTKSMRMQMASSVLMSLRHFKLIRNLILKYCEKNQAGVIASSLIINALNALSTTVDQYNLINNAPDSQLVATVLENTSRPLSISLSTQPYELHKLFTGANLRLEIVGLLLATAGRSMMFGLASDRWNDNSRTAVKPQFTDEMLRSSTTCLVLCTMVSPVNEVMIWMFYENLLITSIMCGLVHVLSISTVPCYTDTHPGPPSWRRLAELATHIYALGVHKESNGSKLPLFMLETRRRIFCASYNMDKTISTFLGRPLRLSKRHTDIKLPLDISDEELTSNQASLELACRALDKDGWNPNGLYLRASWIRLRYVISCYREEILDLTSAKIDGRIVQQLLEISEQCRESWDSLPRHLRYWPTCWDEELPSGVCIMLVIAYLAYLYNEFLIQRLLDRQPLTLNTALLRVSIDLLSTALTLGTIRDQTFDVHRDFLHTILLFGIPSGSVLATALQEQHQTGQHFPQSISRSEIIRSLSVLISHLDSVVRPGDGNYNLCRKATKAFTRVIDAVLDPQPSAPPSNGELNLDLDLDLFTAPGLDGFDESNMMGLFDDVDWGAIGQWTL
ncbi:hypothetical protein K469DRAFT_564200 [Zopfia rhizophila CBS 207.26]|uniref:Xylanolytic transcriptional activator regulatory domain-containing protein n=1 Tax=Zopfia rhizophila CBS 207.26 TaxID=1314779 RepID=A0A6A6EEC0_9PEZI|nr:hypothetical protein K469DRAFT_564200 [Zopfia rhizophila CBS 207.26]